MLVFTLLEWVAWVIRSYYTWLPRAIWLPVSDELRFDGADTVLGYT